MMHKRYTPNQFLYKEKFSCRENKDVVSPETTIEENFIKFIILPRKIALGSSTKFFFEELKENKNSFIVLMSWMNERRKALCGNDDVSSFLLNIIIILLCVRLCGLFFCAAFLDTVIIVPSKKRHFYCFLVCSLLTFG